MHPQDRFWHITLPLGLFCILTTMVVVGWVAEPARFVLGYAPKQPIPFSHKLHAGANRIPCQYCHTNADRSRHATVPAVQTCMNCHRYTRVNNPSIKKITAIFKSGGTLAWTRVYDLPDHVYFDHRAHVNAGIRCQACHGPVQTMKVLTRVMNMRMGHCLDCHRDPSRYLPPGSPVKKGPTNCSACHR
ncbi:MAG: cytochrome c3 family protein [Acidobacteriota bacterium]